MGLQLNGCFCLALYGVRQIHLKTLLPKPINYDILLCKMHFITSNLVVGYTYWVFENESDAAECLASLIYTGRFSHRSVLHIGDQC